MQRVRVGVIGCGSMGIWHIRSLVETEGVEIVGLVDPNEANLERALEANPTLRGTPTFASDQQLYAAVALDAVEINTPHTLHYSQMLTALERGLHILCEKPFVCETEHADEIARRAAAAGVTVTVSYQRRLDPAYQYMRRAIAAGELGELRTIAVVCAQHWKQGTTGSWRQDPLLSGGGMLMDSASHLIDMLLWLADRPVESVAATIDNFGTPVDINCTALIRFAGGAQGQLTAIGDLPATWIENVLITGSEGVLRYETEPQHPWRTGRLLQYRGDELIQPLNLPSTSTVDAAWIAAIRGEAENPAPPAVGVNVARLTEAIYESARAGQATLAGAVDALAPLAAIA